MKLQVPLSLFGGSGNYASALFLAASKANALDKVESEILDLVEASKRSPLFSQFIEDLSVPRETRVKAVQAIFSEVGFSDVTKNFLGTIFFSLQIPLPAEEEKELKQTLQEILGQGKTIRIEQKVLF
ncbi:hypothetical protein B296_00024849 [Ensete ventricosum]|uniref:ATP synthase subunit O, mitochondrial n=1 Tax=Ensete ventricosum TaxID=4639 RepID=A0A426Z8L0_ENSVE|nr:hypothetical protein B296_00024849 [Ensete ventricosum]